jgi:hypothetical protein
MIKYVTWALLGASIAVLLGRWFELYQFGDPQIWIASVIGAALAAISYGGPNEPSFVTGPPVPERKGGALSLSRQSG